MDEQKISDWGILSFHPPSAKVFSMTYFVNIKIQVRFYFMYVIRQLFAPETC